MPVSAALLRRPDLQGPSPTANLDLFHENLSFLIDLLPHGEKKRFAEKLGVDATTISRWKNGAQKPTKAKTYDNPPLLRHPGND